MTRMRMETKHPTNLLRLKRIDRNTLILMSVRLRDAAGVYFHLNKQPQDRFSKLTEKRDETSPSSILIVYGTYFNVSMHEFIINYRELFHRLLL